MGEPGPRIPQGRCGTAYRAAARITKMASISSSQDGSRSSNRSWRNRRTTQVTPRVRDDLPSEPSVEEEHEETLLIGVHEGHSAPAFRTQPKGAPPVISVDDLASVHQDPLADLGGFERSLPSHYETVVVTLSEEAPSPAFTNDLSPIAEESAGTSCVGVDSFQLEVVSAPPVVYPDDSQTNQLSHPSIPTPMAIRSLQEAALLEALETRPIAIQEESTSKMIEVATQSFAAIPSQTSRVVGCFGRTQNVEPMIDLDASPRECNDTEGHRCFVQSASSAAVVGLLQQEGPADLHLRPRVTAQAGTTTTTVDDAAQFVTGMPPFTPSTTRNAVHQIQRDAPSELYVDSVAVVEGSVSSRSPHQPTLTGMPAFVPREAPLVDAKEIFPEAAHDGILLRIIDDAASLVEPILPPNCHLQDSCSPTQKAALEVPLGSPRELHPDSAGVSKDVKGNRPYDEAMPRSIAASSLQGAVPSVASETLVTNEASPHATSHSTSSDVGDDFVEINEPASPSPGTKSSKPQVTDDSQVSERRKLRKERKRRKKMQETELQRVEEDAFLQDQGKVFEPELAGGVVPEDSRGNCHGGHDERKIYDTKSPVFLARRGCKASGIGFFILILFFGIINSPSALIDEEASRKRIMSGLFLVALALVVVEDYIDINKAAIMLMVAVSMWTFLAVSYHPHRSQKDHEELDFEFKEAIADVGAVILFLLPAMGVVETIDHFDGFAVVQRVIERVVGQNKYFLFPCMNFIVFFLSSVIDNLTATIVALKIVRLVVPGHGPEATNFRHTLGGLIVITANSGGAWSPVGDVTTTMLWLKNDISTVNTILWLFVPSLISCVIPMVGLVWQIRRAERQAAKLAENDPPVPETSRQDHHSDEGEINSKARIIVLVFGICMILLVPVLKMLTGLPPYMGMNLALGSLWFLTDTVAFQTLSLRDDGPRDIDGELRFPKHMSSPRSVPEALHKMDLTGLLFFVGVLFAVSALDTARVLEDLVEMLEVICGESVARIAILIGVASAIVDNVPLVQACIDMFGPTTEIDDPLWQLVALAAGTGGSMLSVGSIAGVTYMAMEGVGYIWYVKKVSLWAMLGFFGGIGTYMVENAIFGRPKTR